MCNVLRRGRCPIVGISIWIAGFMLLLVVLVASFVDSKQAETHD